MSNPTTLISTPFAAAGDKNTIQEAVPLEPNNPTWEAGFPVITSTPVSEGGLPPKRLDFNGILNAVTENIVHQTKGLSYEFDATYATKIGGYPLHAELMLENGDIVKSTVANNIINPNVDMTGWVKTNSASFILDESGLSQQQINDFTVTPFQFGAIGDGVSHPLSERYATLAAAQAIYPHATSLTDSIDWAALQSFFNFCKANRVKEAVMSGKFSVNKEINFVQGHNALTKKFTGLLEIIATANMHHVLRVAGSFLNFDNIKISKSNVNLVIPNGLFLGGYLDSASTICSNFASLDVTGFDVASVRVDQNTMFCKFGIVRGGGGKVGTTVFSNLVHGGSGTTQYTEMNLTVIPPHKSETQLLDSRDAPDPNTFLRIDGKPYIVQSINRTDGTVRIFPQYRGTLTTGTIDWYAGAAFHHMGNNAGCIEVDTISVFGGAIGISESSLYSGNYLNIITEFCKVGITVGNNNDDPAMNFNISRGYCEANTIDYIQVGGYSYNVQSNMPNMMGLKPEKIFKLTNTSYVDAQGNHEGRFGQLGSGTYDIGGRQLQPSNEVPDVYATRAIELGARRETQQLIMVGALVTFNFSVNDRLVELFGLSEMILVIKNGANGATPTSGSITLNCPSGYTFDGTATTMTLSGFYKPPIIYVSVYKRGTTKRILVTVDGLKASLQSSILALDYAPKKGTTVQRPTTPTLGQKYYDTTLLATGKPIEWNGVGWVDAVGAVV